MTEEFNYDSDETVILYGDDEVTSSSRNVNFDDLHIKSKSNEAKTTDNKGKNNMLKIAHNNILPNRRKISN